VAAILSRFGGTTMDWDNEHRETTMVGFALNGWFCSMVYFFRIVKCLRKGYDRDPDPDLDRDLERDLDLDFDP
jgi:hypothetical protein